MTNHDQQILDAVIAAQDKGIPYEEAAITICGSISNWNALMDRTIDYIVSSDWEIVE